jgi:hypothetical protein
MAAAGCQGIDFQDDWDRRVLMVFTPARDPIIDLVISVQLLNFQLLLMLLFLYGPVGCFTSRTG